MLYVILRAVDSLKTFLSPILPHTAPVILIPESRDGCPGSFRLAGHKSWSLPHRGFRVYNGVRC
jgi:hypothetical protein